ncbi:hypothetical protein GA0071312_2264 [Saliniramus fredricksonii]|uniref:Uncharacterized protein n=1 Tax=Saliniramus fredricksonii TaxID=1653334 RepID=A0ABY0KA52_9HYPH|nr:hypothetical protein GA0071312_2264 [Saliniramus fredricksonii]
MIEWISPAGMIGAAIGFLIGLVNFKTIGGYVTAKLRETDRSTNAAEKADYERRIRIFRVALFTLTVIAFPVIGYLFGTTVSTMFE